METEGGGRGGGGEGKGALTWGGKEGRRDEKGGGGWSEEGEGLKWGSCIVRVKILHEG